MARVKTRSMSTTGARIERHTGAEYDHGLDGTPGPPVGHSLVAPPPLGAVNRLGLEKYRKFLAGIVAEDGEVQGEEASDTMAANA